MQIGLLLTSSVPDTADLERLVAEAQRAEREGFAAGWVNSASAGTLGLDALTTLAVVGRATERIELGTAIVPTYPRHPMALAQQAATVQSACGGRLVLGVGPSHRPSVEDAWGYAYDRPVRHMREYLAVLGPLVRGERVEFAGETLRARGRLAELGLPPVPVLVSALGPKMLAAAGELADGTITWLAGPRTLSSHVVPTIAAAASAAGRASPRIVVGLPICVTSDVKGARERAAAEFGDHGRLPSYRALLVREGVAGPEDVVLLGDEEAVNAQLDTLAAAGATDLMASEFGSPDERERTRALLRARARTDR